jgi:hypothetical protein
MGARIMASQKLPVYFTAERPKKAPSMKKEPCARFTTPINPKIRDRPEARRNNRTP